LYTSYTNVSHTRASYTGQTQAPHPSTGRFPFRGYSSRPANDGNAGGSSVRFDNVRREGGKPQTQHPTMGMNSCGRKCDICKSPFHLRAACDKAKANGSWQPERANATSVGQDARPRLAQDCARTLEKLTPANEQFAAQTSVSINRVQLDRVGDPLLHAGHQSADVNVGCVTGEMLKPLSNNNVAFNSRVTGGWNGQYCVFVW